MNAERFSDIDELDELHRVRLALDQGWRLLEVVKTKRGIPHSDREFEERPLYIVARPEAETTELSPEGRKQMASELITDLQRALAAHDQALQADEAEQHHHSEVVHAALGRAVQTLADWA